jgi:hypothetical protein
MKYFVAFIFCVFCIVSVYTMTHAEQQIDQCCKTECMGKGGTTENCNSVCSLTDDSGNMIKNSECISSCLNTRYLCYLACGSMMSFLDKLSLAKGY